MAGPVGRGVASRDLFLFLLGPLPLFDRAGGPPFLEMSHPIAFPSSLAESCPTGLSPTCLPVWMFLQHLVDADKEGLVFKALHHAVLVDPKLSGCDSLALRNLRQIELELLVVPLVGCEFLVILNCR